MKPNNTCTSVAILSAVISYLHMIYTADNVASVAGYFVSLGIVPFFVGGAIGFVGVAMLGDGATQGIKKLWWIPAIGTVSAMLPIAYALWRMSQPEH